MDQSGKLRVEFVDVYGNRIGQPVEVKLSHQGTSQVLRASVPAAKQATIAGLAGPPNALYLMRWAASSYRPGGRFVQVGGEVRDISVVCLMDSRKARPAFPSFDALAAQAKAFLPQESYDSLADIPKAGFLNITAKTGRTRFASGRSVLSFFDRLREARGDRLIVDVSPGLREEIVASLPNRLFEPAIAFGHRPPEGFASADSYKTRDRYGNLQVTLFTNSANQWVADVDLDDANGIEHLFQVLRNNLTGRPTHPYDIHQILLLHQELDSGFRLSV
jgi:hypothetical protein